MAEAAKTEERNVPQSAAEASPWRASMPKACPAAIGLCYQTLSQADYTVFFDRYLRQRLGWEKHDLGKPGLDKTQAKSAIFPAHVAGTLCICPNDALWLNVGKEVGLSYDTRLPDLTGGVQFGLSNNFWGTNFKRWWEGAQAFRFTVEWNPAK